MSEIDWPVIQARYESGESPVHISRSLGGRPTKQGIYKRAKAEGWERPNEREAAVEQLPVPQSYWEELDDRQQIVVMAFARGAMTIEDAAKRAMVSESTVYRWKRDERFRSLCECARLATRDRLVSRIDQAGENEWKANAWLLERTHKDEFAPAQAKPGFHGNTFNILGQVDLGIMRDDHHRPTESREQPAPALVPERDE